MADFLGVREDEMIVYADDSNVWRTGSNVEKVARKLAEKAALFVEYTRKMGLSMNAAYAKSATTRRNLGSRERPQILSQENKRYPIH
jgi:hypothetical protein